MMTTSVNSIGGISLLLVLLDNLVSHRGVEVA